MAHRIFNQHTHLKQVKRDADDSSGAINVPEVHLRVKDSKTIGKLSPWVLVHDLTHVPRQLLVVLGQYKYKIINVLVVKGTCLCYLIFCLIRLFELRCYGNIIPPDILMVLDMPKSHVCIGTTLVRVTTLRAGCDGHDRECREEGRQVRASQTRSRRERGNERAPETGVGFAGCS